MTRSRYFGRRSWLLVSGLAWLSVAGAFGARGAAAATPVALTDESEPNNTAGTANGLDFGYLPGAVAAGAIEASGADYYSFSGTAGARVWIDVDTGSPPAQLGSSTDSRVDLFGTDGTTLIEFDDDDGTGNGADATVETLLASVIAGRVLPGTGTFFVRVQSFSAFTIDPYRLYVHVNSLAPALEAEPNDNSSTANILVASGSRVGFTLGGHMAGENDFYSATLQASDRVLIGLDCDPDRDGVSTNVRFQLRGTDGITPIISGASGQESGNFTAEGLAFDIPATGTYFIRVFSSSGVSTGDYTLLVASYPGPDVFQDGFENE